MCVCVCACVYVCIVKHTSPLLPTPGGMARSLFNTWKGAWKGSANGSNMSPT